jgi:hypothetical protein
MGHWKKVFKSNYLASCDVEGKDLVLVISHVTQEVCKLATGDEECNLAHFTDKRYKSMILNVGNSKIVKGFAGGGMDTDTWKNIPVAIFVDQKVRFGRETVEGLRIRPVQPKTAETPKPKLTPESANWKSIVTWAQQEGNKIESVWAKYDVTPEDQLKFKEALEEKK